MIHKEKSLRLLIATIRSLFIFLFGSVTLFFLVDFVFTTRDPLFLGLGSAIAFVVLFAMVALIITEIFRFKTRNDISELRCYSRREMLLVFGRSFFVVASGLLLGIFYWAQQSTVAEMEITDYIFYTVDVLLTFYALGSVIKGERLREVNLRRIQNENALLKTQLNPHFLYNTLNNIDSLIAYDPDKASEAIVRLSSLMRYMTYKTARKEVSVIEECNYLSEFIELQRMRFENPNLVDFQIDIQDKSVCVAPMLLIPFVENAFKHATDKQNDAAIRISIRTENKTLFFESENAADPTCALSKDREGGVGLNLVKRRLHLLYPDRYALRVLCENNRYRVSLHINYSYS